MHLRRLGPLGAALLAWSACSSLDDPIFEPRPDAAPAGPKTTLAYAGSYDAVQRWDLSAIFLDDEGVGGLLADLVVRSIVQLAGVPEALRDEARELIADAIRAPIRDYVNGRVPDDLIPRSALWAQLADIFADVELGGVIGFAVGDQPDAFSGSQKVESIRLAYDGASYDVPIDPLLLGGYGIEGDFAGRVTGQTALEIDDYALAMSLGTLVSLAGQELLDRGDLAALTDQALAAIVCAELVALVLDGDEAYGLVVGGQAFSVTAADLLAGCDAVKGSLADHVLGYFAVDTPVTVGGGLTMADVDDDQVVDTLRGGASYRGEAALVADFLVRPFDIVFDASHQ